MFNFRLGVFKISASSSLYCVRTCSPLNPYYDSEDFLPSDWDVDYSAVRCDDLNHVESSSDCYCAGDGFFLSQTSILFQYLLLPVQHLILSAFLTRFCLSHTPTRTRIWRFYFLAHGLAALLSFANWKKKSWPPRKSRQKIPAVLRMVSPPLSMPKAKAWTDSMSFSLFKFQWIAEMK